MCIGVLLALMAISGGAQSRGLRVVWVDVEGGAATLFIAPGGQSLLFDTGFSGNDNRDAARIAGAARREGLTRIDHVVISHWHGDHVGGLEALSTLMPLGLFYDHGDGVEEADRTWQNAYRTVAGTRRHIAKPGETIAVGDVRFHVVMSEGPVIAKPLAGGARNPSCINAARQAPAGPENIRMVGLVLTYRRFTMATLGDADWSREMELACPVNKLGRVNLYTINRHGSLDNSGAPALLSALQPQVIVVNNGPRKGLGQKTDVRMLTTPGETPTPYEPNSYLRLARLPGIEGIWQGHQSLLDQGHTITATVTPDGGFTVTNNRNGFTKRYMAR
jgi:beta-lactamase superfamily II metal-dependent hydrolase